MLQNESIYLQGDSAYNSRLNHLQKEENTTPPNTLKKAQRKYFFYSASTNYSDGLLSVKDLLICTIR